MSTPHRLRRSRSRPTWLVPSLAIGAVLTVSLAVAIAAGGGTETESEATGEYSAMGVPVIETPGTAADTVSAGPVEVRAANWELGTVPLDVAVRPYWMLRNDGDRPVTVGQPHAQVNEGCCPGPFSIDATTIEPGDEVILTFELAMHPGMDGWHDMDVHVPIASDAEQETLTFNVTGDFRNA